MSTNPLDSFVVDRSRSVDTDDMPSVTAKRAGAGNHKAAAVRSDTNTAEQDATRAEPAKDPHPADSPEYTLTSIAAVATDGSSKNAASANNPAAKKTLRLSRKARLGIYLGILIAALLFIAIAAGAMLSSTENWQLSSEVNDS